jgi:hypothetical protein
MKEISDRLPTISFETQRNINTGETTPWSGDVFYASGYNDLAELIDGISHEFQHVSEGVVGRTRTGIQDAIERMRGGDGLGERHKKIYDRARQIGNSCVR